MRVQWSFVLGLILWLAACGGDLDRAPDTQIETCSMPQEGKFYVVRNGMFMPADNLPVEIVERVEVVERVIEAPVAWDDALEDRFADLGYPWMGLNVRDEVATLTGLAPSLEEKERAFAIGESAIEADDAGSEQVSLIVDGISVEGGAEGVGTALADLDERPSLLACQTAFTRTMDGRNVEFESNSDVISNVSARLLDAITGVAILCKDYNVEIGGHSDTIGPSDLNLELSTSRARSVYNYLTRKGVPSGGLTVVGYGETRPLFEGDTERAHARNRRTEFTVSER